MEITTKAKNPKAAGVKKSKVAAANAKAKAAEITIGNECTEGTEGVEGIYGYMDIWNIRWKLWPASNSR